MERIQITETLSFSRIVYGMWRIGDDADTSPGHIRNKIEACLDQGITTMDQADIYGGYAAEELLGAALAGTDLREKIEVVTKCDIVAPMGRYTDARVKYYDTSSAHIRASVDHSLQLMGIDHIDTLAEAYFQSGNPDKAIETLRRGAREAPYPKSRERYLHLQYQRFRRGNPDSEPPPVS